MTRESNGNGIYELTDEDRELITHHKLFYDELCTFGNRLLDIGFQNGMEHYKLTIYSFIYKILELLDTLKVMTEQSLINSAFIIVRSLFDACSQLYYIVFDDKSCKKKSLIFQLYMLIEKSGNRENVLKDIEVGKLFGEFVSIFQNKKKYARWYAYENSELTSVSKLYKTIGWEKLYTNFYVPMCSDTHASNCMSDIDFVDEKFMFKPYRSFENHILLLHSVLTVMLPLYDKLINVYGNDAFKSEWNDYQKKINQYLTSNDVYSSMNKLFNPTAKWFFRE